MIKKTLLLLSISTVLGLYANPTQESQQMILTLAEDWNSTT